MGETRPKKTKKSSQIVQDSTREAKLQAGGLKTSSQVQVLVKPVPSSKASSATSTSTQSNGSAEKDFTDHIEVVLTQDKGFAVFTKRKIPVGALLIAEAPLIRLTKSEENLEKSLPPTDQSILTLKYDSLPKATQKTYLKLHDSQKSTFPRLKSIYYSNCYNLSPKSELARPAASLLHPPTDTESKERGGSCLGLLSSRINHSCVPNVQFSFSESTGQMLFHAIRAIPRGREVLSAYDTVFETRAQRQRKQIMYYGFRCACDACQPPSPFWERSDDRRTAMIEARGELRDCERLWEEKGGNESPYLHGKDASDALVKLEGLLVKEGLMGLPLADTYAALARWAMRTGETQMMQRWLRKEHDVCVDCLGPDAVRVEEIKGMLEPR